MPDIYTNEYLFEIAYTICCLTSKYKMCVLSQAKLSLNFATCFIVGSIKYERLFTRDSACEGVGASDVCKFVKNGKISNGTVEFN